MKIKSYYRPSADRRITSLLAALARILAATLVAWACCSTDSLAGTELPPWMHDLAAAVLPDHDETTDAVVLYSDTTLTVDTSGKIRRRERRAYRILRPEGEHYGNVRLDVDGQRRFISMHAWCLPVNGKQFQVNDKDVIETAISDVENGELMSDVRARLLHVPQSVPGSIVGFEYEIEEHPYFVADDWLIQSTIPVRETHYTLQLPAGWAYRTTWINHSEIDSMVVSDREWRWSASDVAPIKVERQMPPWKGLAGRLVISLVPPGARSGGALSWEEIGRWYGALTSGRRNPSPELSRQVAAITASDSDRLGKIRAIARFVQSDVRYVAIELGLGGQQPHAASEVLLHHYGDCKDKVTLLSAMLKEIGVDSNYVLVNTVRGTVGPDRPATLDFNHVILAIQLPPDVNDPSLVAIVDHARLGRVLFFDPTNLFAPLGGLAGHLQANYGLLVTADGGELVALPLLSPASNAVTRTASFSLDGSGALHGDVREVHIGDAAAEQRSGLINTARDTDRIKPVEALLARSLSTFEILKASVLNVAANDRPFEWHYSIDAGNYARSTGGLTLVRPRVLGTESSDLLETKEVRRFPIEFEGPERDTDVFDITLPAGYQVDELPQPVNADYDFASYHSKSEFSGGTLRYSRTLEIKEASVPASNAAQLRELYRTIASDEREVALLKAPN